MLNAIVFNDEITLYWDRAKSYIKGDKYKVQVNGETFYAEKTHYELYNLQSEQEFSVKVTLLNEKGEEKEFIGEEKYVTSKNKNKIDVTKPPYNAIGDGVTNNRTALQKAFDDCTENDYIYIPKGVFLTGGLRLHSNSELYVEKGAVIQGTTSHKDYLPKIWSRFEGTELYCYQSVINMGELDRNGGYNCKNVIIRGGGQIRGGGAVLRKDIIETERILLKEYMESLGEKIKECESLDTIPGRPRGRLVNMSNCQNIILSNIEFFEGPAWNIHFIYSDNIITNRCSITSKGISNGDGWNPDSSTNCTVFDCVFDTGDDCIAIKSGKNPEGNVINRPTKNIKIFDIKVFCGHSVALGSEMSGGIDGVYIWDSDITKIELGIRVKVTKKRGGYVKNLFVYDSVLGCAVITAKYNCNDDGEGANEKPYLENFYFENSIFTGSSSEESGRTYSVPCLSFDGMDDEGHHVKKVTIKNCILKRDMNNQPAKVYFERVDGLVMDNVIFE